MAAVQLLAPLFCLQFSILFFFFSPLFWFPGQTLGPWEAAVPLLALLSYSPEREAAKRQGQHVPCWLLRGLENMFVSSQREAARAGHATSFPPSLPPSQGCSKEPCRSPSLCWRLLQVLLAVCACRHGATCPSLASTPSSPEIEPGLQRAAPAGASHQAGPDAT